MNGHNDPRYLKWEEGRAPREARIRRVYNAVKRLGEMSELSTTERGCTHPEVTVEVGHETFAATARLLTGEEREHAFARAVTVFPPYGRYQRRTARQIPVFLLERRAPS